MGRASFSRSTGRNLAAACALSLTLAACGTANPDDPNRPAANPDSLGSRLLLGNAAPQPLTAPEDAAIKRACPPVEVLGGASAYRVFDPPSATDPFSVRYQASIAETARECTSLGLEVAIRVGIVGRVILGPKGAPGQYRIPLRIAVVDEAAKPVFSQVRMIDVAVAPGETKGDFAHVEDAISVPPPPNRFRDWRIVVGYDSAPQTLPKTARRRG